mmetsp:Transcript_46873/g.68834  ORF Transcript_46873/g.68834 Transcript_46873/m.68834 type:complete len:84 (+) Transcript_46873:37-288(+)|eukprot:CAMPEP_0179438374 /NCGR_PEP_ID=MMETSP0799-20121207/22126_1 /TAXON_ID=46947 /ORGANISM="Geminigera cryophila, Strain CCMP2564" /LENGTH=83 /DNA_ID=CAMNT_0021219965 /DNA_START=35 /DNA_END=286 /DNA_ORIENTATION=+
MIASLSPLSTPALGGLFSSTMGLTALFSANAEPGKDCNPETKKDDYEYPYDDFAKSKILNDDPDDFASYMAKRKAAEEAAKGK